MVKSCFKNKKIQYRMKKYHKKQMKNKKELIICQIE